MYVEHAVLPRLGRLRRAVTLSREAKRRLAWIDYYLAHGRHAQLTYRPFGISSATFYRWWHLLIAAGKDPLYIAKQMGHKDPGFTLRQYGHLFETIKRIPVEWIEDLVWPTGCHASITLRAATTRIKADERAFERTQASRQNQT